MSSKIVNIDKEPYDIYIGRGSIWGNPFIIGKHGNRNKVIEKYREYLLKNKFLMDNLKTLKDKVLGCHCKPLKCHGDVLVELIDKMENIKEKTND